MFDGVAGVSKVGIVLKGWDLDENDGWLDNKKTIVDVSTQIAQAIK